MPLTCPSARRLPRPVLLAAVATSTCLLAAAGCNLSEPKPFDPAALGDLERDAAADAPRTDLPPISDRLESPLLPENARDGGRRLDEAAVAELERSRLPEVPEVALPLREVIQRAVVNSFDLKVAGFDPAIEETRVVEADARFDPVAFAEAQLQYNQTRANQGGANAGGVDPLTGLAIPDADFFTDSQTTDIRGSLGLRQALRSGGEAELRYDSNYLDLDEGNLFNEDFDGESFEQQLSLRVTQPLLRDFGRGVNEARIVINRNNQRISVLDFRQEAEELVFDVEQTYWQLTLAIENVEIQEELLARTIDTAETLFRRKDNDVTRVQLAQANAQVESRRALLTRARADVRDLSDQLKRLMNDPSLPVAGSTLILPATEPVEQRLTFDLDDLIGSGLINRPELSQQQLRVGSAGTALLVAESNILPRLDLVLTAGIQGIGEDYDDSFEEVVDDPGFTGGAGVQFEVPIGNRAARAIYLRAMLQRDQAATQYRALVEQVSLDVKTSLRAVETSYLEIGLQRQSRLAAADALQALESREEAGEPRTPAFVNTKLGAQADLADAQRREAQAITDYNTAIAQLEQAKGTLLRYSNILLDEADAPVTRTLPRR